MGDQVGEEIRCTKFGVLWGDMPIFNCHSFLYAFFFFKQPTGQSLGQLLTQDRSKYAKSGKA